MTKEELEKEAEEFTDTKKSFWRQGRTCIGSVKQAYIAGAEPREKRIADLEKENAELKERLLKVENAYKRKSEAEWRLNDLYQKLQTDYANAEKCSREYFTRYRTLIDRCVKAEGIIRKLLDVLTAIDGEETKELKTVKEAEQFLEEN